MARGTLDAAAAAAAEWAGIKTVTCPLCGAVMEAEQFRIGDPWRCEDCGASGKVIDDKPVEVADVTCPTCLGTKEVPAVDIVSGDETELVPCPDCQIPTISPLNPGEETGVSAGQGIGCNVSDDAPLPKRGLRRPDDAGQRARAEETEQNALPCPLCGKPLRGYAAGHVCQGRTTPPFPPVGMG